MGLDRKCTYMLRLICNPCSISHHLSDLRKLPTVFEFHLPHL